MIFIIFLIICIAFFINLNFLSYNETILLSFFFLLFFLLCYTFIKKGFKFFIFSKIINNFFYIFLSIKLNNFFGKLLNFFNALRLIFIKKLIYRILLLKKKSIINIHGLINYYLLLLSLIYFFHLSKKYILNYRESKFNLLSYLFILKVQLNDHLYIF